MTEEKERGKKENRDQSPVAAGQEKAIEMEVLREIDSCLVEGQGIFESHGYSVIGTVKEGKKKLIKIPVTTRGIYDLTKRLEAQAPQPPVIEKVIKADSEQGKAMGLEKDRGVMFYDLTDQTYMEALERHGEEVIWRTVIAGLEVNYKPQCCGAGDNFEQKRDALLAHGITYQHVQQIYSDIKRLSMAQEDREDFLPDAPRA